MTTQGAASEEPSRAEPPFPLLLCSSSCYSSLITRLDNAGVGPQFGIDKVLSNLIQSNLLSDGSFNAEDSLLAASNQASALNRRVGTALGSLLATLLFCPCCSVCFVFIVVSLESLSRHCRWERRRRDWPATVVSSVIVSRKSTPPCDTHDKMVTMRKKERKKGLHPPRQPARVGLPGYPIIPP